MHGHYGRCGNSTSPVWADCMSGDIDTVRRRAARANIRLTVVSPLAGLMPRGHSDPVSANADAARVSGAHDDICCWALVDPLKPETFEQAKNMLDGTKCVGIKVHPEEHGYHIRDYGRILFEFAAARRCVVLTHSGEENSMPGDFVPFADAFPEMTLILAHLGHGHDGDPTHQVRAIQLSKHDNVFVDTSSACNVRSGLIEWAVRETGADRMLFGTDSPLYFAPMQRARIDYADISEADKRKILCENAQKLLGM